MKRTELSGAEIFSCNKSLIILDLITRFYVRSDLSPIPLSVKQLAY